MKKAFYIYLCLFISACSGGGGGSNNTNSSLTTGVLMDSAVGGVHYRSDRTSGMTDDQGRYECLGQESVEFYLKGDNGKEISLGASSCRGVTSPIDLATEGQFGYKTDLLDLSSSQNTHVVGLLRLLQSLDADQNPSNGITISPVDVSIVANILEQSYTLNVALESLFSSGEGYETILSSVISATGKTLVSETSAISHFNETRNSNPEPCETESCSEPTTPPIINPPQQAQTECYQGVSYGSAIFGQGGLTYGTNYPIDVNTGENKSGSGFNEQIYTLIVIPATGNAEFYRRRNSAGAFNRFSVEMTVREEISGIIHLRGVGFSDGIQTLTLGAKINSGGIMTRMGSQLSFGNFVSADDRTFRKVDCYPPSTYVYVGQ